MTEPAPALPANRHTLKDILLLPITCLTTFSPPLLAGSLLVVTLVVGYIYFNFNIDLLGLNAPNFSELTIDSHFEHVQSRDRSWAIQYETGYPTAFTGKVRHVSPIRDFNIPLLTHDILVTSGDFADPARVTTSVSNHHFVWAALTRERPQGAINLLHTVPQTEAIYRQLLQVQADQRVTIVGYEILKIDVFDSTGRLLGGWADTGCNSLLVRKVVILP